MAACILTERKEGKWKEPRLSVTRAVCTAVILQIRLAADSAYSSVYRQHRTVRKSARYRILFPVARNYVSRAVLRDCD